MPCCPSQQPLDDLRVAICPCDQQIGTDGFRLSDDLRTEIRVVRSDQMQVRRGSCIHQEVDQTKSRIVLRADPDRGHALRRAKPWPGTLDGVTRGIAVAQPNGVG